MNVPSMGFDYQADLFDEVQATLFADLEPPAVPHFPTGEEAWQHEHWGEDDGPIEDE